MLEAHLLSRRSLVEVAERTAQSRSTINTYQTYFFALGELLQSPAYVYAQVIAPELTSGLAPATAERHAAMKFIAYRCGPDTLDRALGHGEKSGGPLWQRASNAFADLQELADLRWLLADELRGPAHSPGRRSSSEIIAALEESHLNDAATHPLGRRHEEIHP